MQDENIDNSPVKEVKSYAERRVKLNDTNIKKLRPRNKIWLTWLCMGRRCQNGYFLLLARLGIYRRGKDSKVAWHIDFLKFFHA